MAGAFVGAGVTMWLVPRAASELRERMAASARELRQKASDQYAKAGAQVGETAGALVRKGQRVRDDVADAVARGAHEVERYATAARTERVAEVKPPPAAGG